MAERCRERPPDRRRSFLSRIDFRDTHYHVRCGLYPDGRLCEVFAYGDKAGSDRRREIDDACVIVSLAVQWGADINDIALSMGRDGDYTPASALGAVIDCAARAMRKAD